MVIWDKVQTCTWPSRCHCHSLSLAPVNPDWFYLPGFYLSGTCSPGWSRTNSRRAVKRLCVWHFRDTLHATAVLTNCLGSSVPLGSEYVSLETWDNRARRLLTLKTSRRRLGGQPWPPRTPCSSRCRLQVYRCGSNKTIQLKSGTALRPVWNSSISSQLPKHWVIQQNVAQ